jgi:hypothetical protein
MARRLASIVTAIGCWTIGAVLLAGAAGFLFAAVVHPAGSDGWVIAAAGMMVLTLAGTGSIAVGWWLASPGTPTQREPAIDDDAMWIG